MTELHEQFAKTRMTELHEQLGLHPRLQKRG